MSDMFDALIGEQPVDPVALAASLRQKQQMGTVAALTGISGLQKLGPQMINEAASGAQDYATLRDRTMNQGLQRALQNQGQLLASQDRQDAIAQRAEAAKQHSQLIQTLAAQKAANSPQEPTLSPDAVHDAVVDVLADPARMRQYASFGQSGQKIRTAINEQKSQTLRDLGMTEDQVVRQQAVAKAQIKSVGDLIPMQNAINAYETVAKGNGQRALELINKVNTTGVPLLNSAKRISEQATGNPDAAELMQVLQNYQTEAARIIANPRLTGQLTDTARKELENVIPANLTPAQAKRIIERLNFEFELRSRGIDQALTQAQSQMTPGYAPASSPAGAQAPAAPAMSAADRAKAMGL